MGSAVVSDIAGAKVGSAAGAASTSAGSMVGSGRAVAGDMEATTLTSAADVTSGSAPVAIQYASAHRIFRTTSVVRIKRSMPLRAPNRGAVHEGEAVGQETFDRALIRQHQGPVAPISQPRRVSASQTNPPRFWHEEVLVVTRRGRPARNHSIHRARSSAEVLG